MLLFQDIVFPMSLMWAADISRVVIWRQMGASVLLSKESPITKTLHL